MSATDPDWLDGKQAADVDLAPALVCGGHVLIIAVAPTDQPGCPRTLTGVVHGRVCSHVPLLTA